MPPTKWGLLCSRFCFTKKNLTKVKFSIFFDIDICYKYTTRLQNDVPKTILGIQLPQWFFFTSIRLRIHNIDTEYDNVWTLYTVWKVEKQQCMILKWRTMKQRWAKLKNTCTDNLATLISWREHGSLVWSNLWTSSCWPLSLSNGWDW